MMPIIKMDNIEITLLSEGQIWGNNEEAQLGVIKKYGIKTAITDLCILTGCEPSYYSTLDENISLKGRTGCFWTKSNDGFGKVLIVITYGCDSEPIFSRDCAIRPVIDSSVIFSQVYKNRVEGYNGIFEVEYGEYPQYAADSSMQRILNLEYFKRRMNKTGKEYTFDSRKFDDTDKEFKPVTYEEYEYQGKKYIRIKANYGSQKFMLSNGEKYKGGDYVWVEVSPIKWLIDEKTKTLISKYGLVSGIRFHNKNYHGDFKQTEMYKFLNKYLVKDIIPSKVKNDNISDKENTNLQKKETYTEKLINKINEELNKIDDNTYVNNIINKINNLIEEYNKSLNEKEKLLEIEGKVYKEVMFQRKLEEILDHIQNKYSLLKTNYEIKEYLNNILNNKENNINDDLINDLNIIIYKILPLLNNNLKQKYNDLLNKIINEEIDKINKNINSIYNGENNNITKEDIKLSIRKKLQLLLIELNKDNINNNEINEIMNYTLKIMIDNYKNNDKYKMYFVVINELYNELKEKEDIINLNEIILIDEINETNLKNIINKLYELKYKEKSKNIKKLQLR